METWNRTGKLDRVGYHRGVAEELTTEQIWKELHNRLFGFILRRVRSEHDAEDILQTVFMRIHEKLGALKEEGSLTQWVFQITRNAVADFYRERAKQASMTEHLAAEPPQERMPAPHTLWRREALAELARCMEPMVRRLKTPYAEAILQTELDGATHREAANRLGISLPAMKARVLRGREKLKDVLLDCCRLEIDPRRGITDYERNVPDLPDECSCPDGGLS